MTLALAFLAVAIPHIAFGAGSGGFLPIISPTGSCACPGSAPDWGCVLQVIQNVINVAIELGVILCVIRIAYGGFSLMISGGSPEARSLAKTRLLNAVVGIAVILCSWLIVDFVMKFIYEPTTAFEGTTFGPWNSILAGNGIDLCLQVKEARPITTGTILANLSNVTDTGGSLVVGGGGACSAQNVKTGAAAGGYQLTDAEANTFACLAKYESGCGVKNLNYNWNNGSSAAGAFQVLLSDNAACYENPACQAAAGVTGKLNCAAGFKNGNPYPAGNEIALRCVRAAANLSCSASAAACQMRKQGFSAWTADKNSSGQKQCIQ
jgi:hypothetical protein